MAGQIAQDIQAYINKMNFTGDAKNDHKEVLLVRTIVFKNLVESSPVEFLTALLHIKKDVMNVKAKDELENMLNIRVTWDQHLAELPEDVRNAVLRVKFDGKYGKDTKDKLELDRIRVVVLPSLPLKHHVKFLQELCSLEKYGMKRGVKNKDAEKLLDEIVKNAIGTDMGHRGDEVMDDDEYDGDESEAVLVPIDYGDDDYEVMGDDETPGDQAHKNSISIDGRRGREPTRQAYEQLKQHAEDLEEENNDKEEEIMKLRAKIRALKAGSTGRRREQISRLQKSNAVIWV
mmetsp:Transcript_9366/g.13687  ORF Transcript_9366/g.13687 Transcript_9366/m.13687 type:complete len:289 (+) Transcript_9366:100-966(+)